MFSIVIERKAQEYLKTLPQKTRRIVVEKILELGEDPFPGGSRERLVCPRPPEVYRLRISRSFTVFYVIEHEEKVVKIEKITTIEKANKEYSRR